MSSSSSSVDEDMSSSSSDYLSCERVDEFDGQEEDISSGSTEYLSCEDPQEHEFDGDEADDDISINQQSLPVALGHVSEIVEEIDFEIDQHHHPPAEEQQYEATRVQIISNYVRQRTIRDCRCLLTTGGLFIGYMPVVLGGLDAFPQYLFHLSPRIYHKQVRSYQTSSSMYQNHLILFHVSIIPLTTIVGSFIPQIFNRHGRKMIMIGSSLQVLVGTSCILWFPEPPIIEVFGRVMIGIGLGSLQSIPIFCGQLLPKESQDGMIHTVSILVGGALASGTLYLASYFHVWGWRVCVGVSGIPIIMMLVKFFDISETPQYYIERGQMQLAESRLREIRGVLDVEDDLFELIMQKNVNPFREIIRVQNRPVLIISIVTTVMTKTLGIDTVGFMGPFILQSLGYSAHEAYLSASLACIIQLASKMISIPIIRRFGRRTVYPLALSASSLSTIGYGIIMSMIPNSGHHLQHLSRPMAIGATCTAIVHNFASGFLPGPLEWLDSTYPTECVEVGSMITNGLNGFLTFVSTQLIIHLLCGLGPWLFFAYSALFIVYTILVLLFLPETRDVPQEDMGRRVWSRHWFWRRFVRSRETSFPLYRL